MMESRVRLLLLLAITGAVAYMAANFSLRGGIYLGIAALPLLGLVLSRPDVGLVVFVIAYPLLPSSEGVTTPEILSAVMLLIVLFGWFFDTEFRGRASHSPRHFVPLLAFWYGWLLLSLFFTLYSGGRAMDWLRDMVPLANIALALVVKDFFVGRRFITFLAVVVTIMIATVSRGVLASIGIHLPSGIIMHTTTYHPAVLLVLGISLVALSGRYRWLGTTAMIMATALAIATTNRTTFISILLTAFLVLTAQRVRGRAAAPVFAAILIGYVFYLGFQEYRPRTIAEKESRLESLLTVDQDLSFQNRRDEAKECWRLFFAHPLAGVGLGYKYHFWRHFIAGLGPGYLDTNYTHSDFLDLLAKTGLVGVVLWLFVIGSLVGIGADVVNRARDSGTRMLGIGLTVAVLVSQVIGQSTPVLQTREATYLLGIVMGLLVGLHREVTEEGATATDAAEGKEGG